LGGASTAYGDLHAAARAKLSVYDRTGHAPFWEDTARFNAELSAFVRTANATTLG
jgi:pimeloyl-ACP methyl ester carboxylesterase